jgi:hypothetical protein
MRIFAFFVIAFFTTTVACASNITCGCATLQPSVTVTVKDAVTHDLVPNPTFSLGAATVNGQCIGIIPDDAGEAGTPNCEQWRVTLPVGHSTLVVSAAGYQPQTFTFDTTLTNDCCQTGTQLTQTAELTH